jgi:hypothetical protein
MIIVKYRPNMIGRHGEPAVSYDHIDKLQKWCSEHCENFNEEGDRFLTWKFINVQDAMFFKLKWG